ncbi:hypothetical protein [Streptomyces coelicoflavus]|uniref:hypothetical protein n=1 Tax=Streptomyces coelicoflavus TaxID=285562 RepID=UPI003F4A3E60
MSSRPVSRRTAAVVAMAVSGLLVAAPSSSAGPDASAIDNIVPTSNYYVGCLSGEADGTVCRTDNATLTYYMDSGGSNQLEAGDKSIVRAMLASEYSPTDLAVSYDSTPSWSGSAETDIYYSEGAVPGSNEGTTFCNDNSPGNYKCDQQYIRIEGGGHYTPGLSCHETGHAVGLLHGNVSYPAVPMQDSRLGCMKKNVSYSQRLGANQKTNINIVY